MRIVPAASAHVPAIAAIYHEAAVGSYATFDVTGHPEQWWHEALAHADPGAGRFVLVALDDGGELLGYAKSGAHRERPAYDTTCETAVYLAGSARGRGVGRALYGALLARLDDSPLRAAVAGVAEPNEASTRLHLACGFTRVGTFSGAGVKRGRAWDVTWYERPLAVPAPVAELRSLVAAGASRDELAAAIRAGGGYRAAVVGEGEVPILDPATGERLAALGIATADGAPLGRGDRLLLDWCAEALAPLFTR